MCSVVSSRCSTKARSPGGEPPTQIVPYPRASTSATTSGVSPEGCRQIPTLPSSMLMSPTARRTALSFRLACRQTLSGGCRVTQSSKRRLLLRVLTYGVCHVDDADDYPDQGHEHDGCDARGTLEHDRGYRQRDQHRSEGQREGLLAEAVGPFGP